MSTEIEETYAMIKPGYEEFWGKVVERIIEEGLEIVRMKTMNFDADFASKFYAEHVGKGFYDELAGYMTSGPIVALNLRGNDAIKKWREIIGPTKKEVAVETAPNSLRALYARSTTENLCHGSDSPTSAEREINLVFSEEIAEEKKESGCAKTREANNKNKETEKKEEEKKEEEKKEEEKEDEKKDQSKCCILI